jgi:hypothetical protein
MTAIPAAAVADQQLALFADAPTATPAGRAGGTGRRRVVTLRLEFDLHEWQQMELVAARTGTTVAEVAESALAAGLRAYLEETRHEHDLPGSTLFAP